MLLLGSGSLLAQTEDTLVVELLYRADRPTTDDVVYIDRAAVYHYGEVVASAPIEEYQNLEYTIKDTFGVMGKGGAFKFYRDMLPDLDDKIPVAVTIDGRYHTGFLKIAPKKSLRFNFYTDKIKPVLNFWINVEGIKNDTTILPLSADEVILTTSYGEIVGLELILPETPTVSSVTLEACLVEKPNECVVQTVPIMKKDAQGHWEDEDEYNPGIDKDGKEIDENPNVPGYKKKTYYIEEEDNSSADEDTEILLEAEPENMERDPSDSKWDYLFKKVFRKKSED